MFVFLYLGVFTHCTCLFWFWSQNIRTFFLVFQPATINICWCHMYWSLSRQLLLSISRRFAWPQVKETLLMLVEGHAGHSRNHTSFMLRTTLQSILSSFSLFSPNFNDIPHSFLTRFCLLKSSLSLGSDLLFVESVRRSADYYGEDLVTLQHSTCRLIQT